MIKNLINLSFTQTGKDTGVVFLGTLINIIIGGLFFILAPRILGPADYGLFSVILATGLMVFNFANFGIDTGILRFIKPGQKETNQKYLKLAFKAYLAIGFLIFSLGYVFSPIIAQFLDAPQTENLLRIAFGATMFSLLGNFFVAVLQTQKQFIKASAVNISANAARLVILAIASYFLTIDLHFLTILVYAVTILYVIFGKIFVPLDFLRVQEEHLHFKNFFGYNFWVAASLAISAIPFDNYLLVKIAGPVATGLYAAPMKILAMTYQFAGSFSRVLASRYSSFDSNRKAIEFSQKATPLVLAVFFGLLVISFLANPIVRLFFGNQYQQSIQIFRITSVGMAFFFADTIPVSIILYYFGRSKVTFYVTVWHYLIYVLLLLYFIPRQSALGAAIAFSISEIITFLTLSAYVVFKFRK